MSSPPPGAVNPRPPYQLFQDQAEKIRLEARNLLLQYDEVVRLVNQSGQILQITPQLIRNLHRLAIQDIYSCAGNFRTSLVGITNSLHRPPAGSDVQGLVDDMCAYANSSTNRSPIHTAAYLLWRMNWIHPFNGGNGRTARALSYLALCVRLGYVLPGTNTIIAQLEANRPYYICACHYADALWGLNPPQLNVSAMEMILTQMLNNQLAMVFSTAVNAPPPAISPPPPAPATPTIPVAAEL
jgi:fido (protein-threonine AMPylation protein)